MKPRNMSVFGRSALAIAIVGALLVAVEPSRGQGKLSSEQEAALEVFNDNIREVLAKTKEACGPDFKLITDFEHYDEAAWKATYRRLARSMTAGICGTALEDAALVCAPPAQEGGKGPKRTVLPWKPVAVKSVTCLFSGASAQRDREANELHLRRNATFEKGAFTVRISPPMALGAGHPFLEVMRGIALTGSVANGGTCQVNGECKSNLCIGDCKDGLCARGTCGGCSAKRACTGRMDVCKAGICVMPPPKHLDREGDSGDFCKTAADCKSRVCEWVVGNISKCL